jgi:hypothetical protein
VTERPSNRPGKAEPWPKMHRKLTLQLEPSDRIFFRSVNARGIPAGVGAGNAGKPCAVIIGHKKIEDLEKVRSFRDLEEYKGSSVNILPDDVVFSCQVDSIGAPYSVGSPNKGKDVTIIVYEEEAQNKSVNLEE